MQSLSSCVPGGDIELCQPHEYVSSEWGQMGREGKLGQSKELFLVLFCLKVFGVVQWMFTSCQQHVHDDASCKDVNTFGVSLLEHLFWPHENQGACVSI